VLGNPLKYTDPSGHGQCQTQEDCDDMGTTPMGTGGSTGGGGGGNGGGGSPHDDDDFDPNPHGITLPSPEKNVEYPWEYSYTEVEGIHLGPTRHVFFPDYNDDGYNGFPHSWGPYDDSDNFFITFNIYYNQSSGIHMSDISWSNLYDGLVILDSVDINSQTERIDSPYLLADGVWNPISGTGGDWDSETSISINVNLGWIGNAGNGPFPIFATISVNVPSLNQVINFRQP